MCSEVFFFFKQKTAYEMRISDWSSDVCSSDLESMKNNPPNDHHACPPRLVRGSWSTIVTRLPRRRASRAATRPDRPQPTIRTSVSCVRTVMATPLSSWRSAWVVSRERQRGPSASRGCGVDRSEEHTSELQSLMRNSEAVLCLKKKNKNIQT